MAMLSRFSTIRVFLQHGIVYIEYRVEGKRTRFSTKLKATKANLKAIEKNKHQIALEHFEKKLENKDIILFQDISTLAILETKGTVIDETYKDNMKSVISYLNPHFGMMDIKKIKASHIESFKNQFKSLRAKDIKKNNLRQNPNQVSQSRYNKTHGVLAKILQFALLHDYIEINPILSIKRLSKSFTKPIRNNNDYFSESEVTTVLQSPKSSLFLCTLLHGYLTTGVRVNEMLHLRWEDIDLKENLIRFTVFKKVNGAISDSEKQKRTLPLSSKFKVKLIEWRKINKYDLVFPNMKTGKLIKNHYFTIVERQYKPFLSEIGVRYISLKNLRKTVASLAAADGASIPMLSVLLSHSDVNTTQRYYIRTGLTDMSEIKKCVEGLIKTK